MSDLVARTGDPWLRYFPYQPHWTDLKGSGSLTPIKATVEILSRRILRMQGAILRTDDESGPLRWPARLAVPSESVVLPGSQVSWVIESERVGVVA